jgi:fructokinase
LGAEVRFVGVLSSDRFGRRLRDQLVADGVVVDDAPTTDVPTTLAAAEIDASGAADYRFYIEGTSAPMLTPAAVAGVPVDGATFFTGGLGLVLEPMASTVLGLVEALSPTTTVVVDVNCRPQVITDRPAWAARLDRILARADLVKASDEDLRYLDPGRDARFVAEELLDRGARSVVVTAGGGRVTIVSADGASTIELPPAAAPVVDTIGAGDTFVGGLLAWLDGHRLGGSDLTTEILADAVRAGHAAAAVVVTRRGADPPWRAELPPEWSRRSGTPQTR